MSFCIVPKTNRLHAPKLPHMGKLLLWAFLILLALIAMRLVARRTSPPPRSVARHDASSQPESMVRCAHCGIHLPRSEALLVDGQIWCSEEHAQLGSGRGQARQHSFGAEGSPKWWRRSSGRKSGVLHHGPKRKPCPSGRGQARRSLSGTEGSSESWRRNPAQEGGTLRAATGSSRLVAAGPRDKPCAFIQLR